jgi:Immunoglobulin I-set domain
MFPNQDYDRMSVTEDGSLVIDPVRREDAGEYVCKALSVAGSAYAKAKLDVRGQHRSDISNSVGVSRARCGVRCLSATALREFKNMVLEPNYVIRLLADGRRVCGPMLMCHVQLPRRNNKVAGEPFRCGSSV